MQWAEPLGLVQREAKVSSIEDIPFLPLEEKPTAKQSKKYVPSTVNQEIFVVKML